MVKTNRFATHCAENKGHLYLHFGRHIRWSVTGSPTKGPNDMDRYGPYPCDPKVVSKV